MAQVSSSFSRSSTAGAPIDRRALVSRHDVVWTDPAQAVPLGNGEFAFNADATGLQTFGGNSMAHWAWHSFPLPEGVTPDQIPATGTVQQGRPTGEDPAMPDAARRWLFENPHAFNMGRLRLCGAGGCEIEPGEVSGVSARLELWTGRLTSSYQLGGVPVRVSTCVHPGFDAVSVRIESALIAEGSLGVSLDFPCPRLKGSGHSTNAGWDGDFGNPEAHTTRSTPGSSAGGNMADFERHMDSTAYHARLGWSSGELTADPANPVNPHRFVLLAKGEATLELTLCFSSESVQTVLPLFAETSAAATAHWEAYWQTGGAIDLSGSKDPRWRELERRIVLSQYNMAAMSAGSYPPSEASLILVDPWGGRFHMEMIWWHLAHYGLWDRWSLAEKAIGVYERFLPMAKEAARQLGMKGALWPKGVGPDGISQPWRGNVALLWKQPHPIYFAELEYRLKPTPATLQKWAEIIEATADYMAAYAQLDPATDTYILKPNMPPGETGLTANSVFDLAYWRWGFDQAQRWRERMGLRRVERWDEVRNHLAPLPIHDGLFFHSTEWCDTYTTRNYEHPDPVGVFGMVPPAEGVDPETARRTVRKIFEMWQWDKTWGWDAPWITMAAARVGEPNLAVDCLLMERPRNRYDWRGINEGGPCPYLPGNGGTLYAVAMMAAGWDGAPDRPAPGFPDDGSWAVKWEGLHKAL